LERRQIGRPKRRWEDNIYADLRKKGCDRGRWIELAQVLIIWRALL